MTDWTLDWHIYPFGAFNSLIAPPAVAPNDATDTFCLTLPRAYLPYLLGSISPLTFPDFYTGTSSEQAEAANYFQTIYAMLIMAGGCPVGTLVRQNTDDPCMLQYSDDEGATWTTFANLQLCPPILVLGQGGQVETSTDGGESFEPVPPAPVLAQPTPPVGQDQKCLACQNGVNVMAAFYPQVVAYFNNGVNVIVVVTGVISLIAIMLYFTPDFPAALTAFTELWSFMTTIVAFPFSSDDQATFLCDLYDNATLTDGVVTVDYTAVIDAVGGRWGVGSFNEWTLVDYLLQIIGADGLDRSLTVQSSVEADCSGCESSVWCYEWSSTADMLLDGWTHAIDTGLSDFWAAGMTEEITDLAFTYAWNGVGGDGDSAVAWWGGTGFTDRVDLVTPLSAAPSPYVWTGDHSCTEVSFGLNAASTSAGVVAVLTLHLEGTGTRPAWTHGTDC